jgi:two-component system response regulator FixJ
LATKQLSGGRLLLMSAEIPISESVYVLDDDPSIRKAIDRLLATQGIKVRGFGDPADFLTFVQTHPVPVAILDVWMNWMTGLEVQFKLTRISPHTRIIMMTGRDDPGVKQTAKEMGAIAFFLKPFDDEEFLSAIRTALSTKRPGKSGAWDQRRIASPAAGGANPGRVD